MQFQMEECKYRLLLLIDETQDPHRKTTCNAGANLITAPPHVMNLEMHHNGYKQTIFVRNFVLSNYQEIIFHF